jgi:hypothetical protein
VHDGVADGRRRAGWCRACHDRIADGAPFPMCYWFTEQIVLGPPTR